VQDLFSNNTLYSTMSEITITDHVSSHGNSGSPGEMAERSKAPA
jgi:hypothetical protein